MTTLYDAWQQDCGGEFAAGVRLLVEAGAPGITDGALARLMQLARRRGYVTDYDKGKLTGALKKIRLQNQPGPASQPVNEMQPPETKSHRRDPELPASPQKPAPAPKAIALHKLHSHHHAIMVAAKTDEERAEHARKIMQEILPALDRYYDRQRSGAPLDEPESAAPAESPGANEADLIRRQAVLRVRISKLTRHLIPSAPTLARKQQLESELAAKRQELLGIEDLLA